MKHTAHLVTALALIASPTIAQAQRAHRPPPPPPEAFDACADLDDGDACSFQAPHGTIEGTCRAPLAEGGLHCVPLRPPPPPPPPEAFDACTDLDDGDACSFQAPHGTVEGTCRAPLAEGGLHCVPFRPPPPPEAFDACTDLDDGDACSFQAPHGAMSGTCRTPPGYEDLLCVPDRRPHGR